MRTTYTPLGRLARRILRTFWPIPGSPSYGSADDICSVRLVPEQPFIEAVRRAIKATRATNCRGAYLEFGVFNGTSLACAHRAARLEDAESLRLLGVDSFKGLPTHVSCEDGGVWEPGQFACSLADTRRCLANRNIESHAVTLIERWYDELSVDHLAAALDGHRIQIAMIDCDAYSSASRALSLITPLLAPIAIIFFDDWRLRDVDLIGGGEYRAFNEWRNVHHSINIQHFPSYSRKSQAFILSSPT